MIYSPEQVEILRELAEEFVRDSHIADECQLITFVSYSKGKGRVRARAVVIELLCYSGQCFQLAGGWCSGLDVIAREITGSDDTVAFLKELRYLERMS